MNLRRSIRPLLPRACKPHRILRGPLAGRTIVTSWHDYPAAILGYAEVSLVQWLLDNVQLNETWVDVGAHNGYTTLAMCERVGSTGKVLAFEPMICTAGHLQKTKQLNKLDQLLVIPLALTSDEGVRLRNFLTSRGMADAQLTHDKAESAENVMCVALDSLWQSLGLSNSEIHGVKIDVQGMELETLRGMQKLLSRFHPKLVVELHKGISRLDILDTLSSCGYRQPPAPIEKDIATDFFDEKTNYSFLFY